MNPNSKKFQIGDTVIEADYKSCLRQNCIFLVEWFFAEFVEVGFNGYIFKSVKDYPDFDRLLYSEFRFLSKLLYEYQNNK